jgi:hypothetical protein
LILDDPQWQLHRDFYARVGDFLAPGGSVLLAENTGGGPPEDFIPMIAEGGLLHVQTLWFTGGRSPAYWYFIWSHKGLPGLVRDERVAVTIPLRDEPGEPVSVPAGAPCMVSASNETDRVLRPRIYDKAGVDQVDPFMQLVELSPGRAADLALLAFRAGTYDVRDPDHDTTLATLVAS